MSFVIELTGDVICITAHGKINLEDVMGLGPSLKRIEDELPKAPNRVMDLSNSTGADLDFPTVSSFARMRNQTVLKNTVRVAIIAPSDFQFGMARMFQSMIANPHFDFCTFRKSDEAWNWATAT
ncbi:MAG: hypothetical protein IPP19_11140 [Verrucomicrobia bacterium]|nr:hypothetical protein [Verrucomicrobiota bacterium]